jgi:hypothetical protein
MIAQTEPTYEYVKGKGWVPTTAKRLRVTTWNNKAIWIVDRAPLKGERYMSLSKDTYKLIIDRETNLHKFAHRVFYKRWEDFKPRRTKKLSENLVYVTLEECNE